MVRRWSGGKEWERDGWNWETFGNLVQWKFPGMYNGNLTQDSLGIWSLRGQWWDWVAFN